MIERRSFKIADVRFATRATDKGDAEGSRMEGYASIFNSDSVDLGGFTERVAPGAFARSLEAASKGETNVFALWSHDTSQPLGSTRGGKLALEEDDKGLRFTLDTSRMTPAQLDSAKDGELRMSFGFSVREQEWKENDDGSVERTLVDVDLFEVSPVISPAYPDTTAAVRSLEAFKASRAVGELTPVEADMNWLEVRNRLLSRHLARRLKK